MRKLASKIQAAHPMQIRTISRSFFSLFGKNICSSQTVPDIDWGKNIRIVLDVQCTDSSFGTALLEKEVLTISLGLMGDQTDLAQLALERGFPAVVGNLATRRLPFPSGVFDAIHCGECDIPWHSKGGHWLTDAVAMRWRLNFFLWVLRVGQCVAVIQVEGRSWR